MLALDCKIIICEILDYMKDKNGSTIMEIADSTGINPLTVLRVMLILQKLCIVMLSPIKLSAENERQSSCIYSLMV